jgi:hypothetical protein
MIGAAFGVVSALGVAGKFASDLMGRSAANSEIQERIRALEFKKAQMYDLEIAGTRRYGRARSNAMLTGAFAGLAGGGANIYGQLATLNRWWEPGPKTV